eukprot:TRINITY_DN12644_c0_g1_i1.p1 TRINITY_DN12644_c0_g1~~TRINITY_DN12644_c0_g1_i1.p1  ORF type:complete len:203 (-),score=42.38 TRINITY_DN12644_c0_g1_i1:11-619(-)
MERDTSPRRTAWSSREFQVGNEFQITDQMRQDFEKSNAAHEDLRGWFGQEDDKSVWDHFYFLRTEPLSDTMGDTPMKLRWRRSPSQQVISPRKEVKKLIRTLSQTEKRPRLHEETYDDLLTKKDTPSTSLQLAKLEPSNSTGELYLSSGDSTPSTPAIKEPLHKRLKATLTLSGRKNRQSLPPKTLSAPIIRKSKLLGKEQQ